MSIKNNYFFSCPETYDQARQTVIDHYFVTDQLTDFSYCCLRPRMQ